MEVMSHSAGTVVLAFERSVVERGSQRGRIGKEPADLSGARYPTVWNQVEAALAYAMGHPLLVIVEAGLHSEGLLESGYDWYAQWVEGPH